MNMNSITVHQVSGADFPRIIPGIVSVFRDDEVVPWHSYDKCLALVSQRIERGFYITAAYYGDKIAGYSEWIETYDKGKKILYLSTMQVDCDLRGRGIGEAMLADGAEYAKSIGASCLRTIPEDERAWDFYRKHAFFETDFINYCICQTLADTEPTPTPRNKTAAISLTVANTNEFIFGLCQASGRHMYELANHYPDISDFLVKTANHQEGYLQFRYRKGTKSAVALYWSNEEATADTMSGILVRGYENGFEEIEFYFKSKYTHLFSGHNVTRENTEIERVIIV